MATFEKRIDSKGNISYRAKIRKSGQVPQCETFSKLNDAKIWAIKVENELLTPSLKVRRKKVYERFHDAFEALYDGGATTEAARAAEREAQA